MIPKKDKKKAPWEINTPENAVELSAAINKDLELYKNHQVIPAIAAIITSVHDLRIKCAELSSCDSELVIVKNQLKALRGSFDLLENHVEGISVEEVFNSVLLQAESALSKAHKR